MRTARPQGNTAITLKPGKSPCVVVPTVVTRPVPRIIQTNKSEALPVTAFVSKTTGLVYCHSPVGERLMS